MLHKFDADFQSFILSTGVDFFRIASRVAFASPLSDRPDYGSGRASVPRGEENTTDAPEEHTGNQEQTGYIKKTPKGYCVKSEKPGSTWSGGCYPTKAEAEKRLRDVEFFKHK